MLKLIEIVEDFMAEEERDTTHKKGIYLHHAINAVRDLTYDTNGVVKYKELTIDTSTNTANLPDDFIREIGAAAIDYNGELVNLSRSKHSIYKRKDDCGGISTTPNSNDGTFGSAFFFNTQSQHYRNGENIGAFFGLGGKQTTGEYKINRDSWRLELSTLTNETTIVLKYLAEPSQINGQFFVMEYLREPIKNFIDWKDKQRKKYIPRGEKQALHAQYVTSKMHARMRLDSFDFEEAREIAQVNFTMSPKT